MAVAALTPPERREQFRNEWSTALDSRDDPLQVFESYIQWLLENTNDEDTILEVLEQAVRTFRNDKFYKYDPRYLKLWTAYINRVDRTTEVYKFLLDNDIGTIFSQFYEDYAIALEKDGQRLEAHEMYKLGVQRKCRALGHLKAAHAEFRKRITSEKPYKPSPRTKRPSQNPSIDSLRSDPLKYIRDGQRPSPSKPLLAIEPKPPSKGSPAYPPAVSTAKTGRKEKICLDVSLFVRDGTEYSIEEARARSLGLLGKKWPPPPELSQEKTAEVDFNEDGRKSSKNVTSSFMPNMNVTTVLSSNYSEPTVTVNTKEAFKAVFGIFNSPEKTAKLDLVGSKHAPLKKVDSKSESKRTTSRPAPIVHTNDENVPITNKPSGFRPFVDENENKENPHSAPAKFKPFVDENTLKAPTSTPATSRTVLGSKESTTPAQPLGRKFQILEDPQILNPTPLGERRAPSQVLGPAERDEEDDEEDEEDEEEEEEESFAGDEDEDPCIVPAFTGLDTQPPQTKRLNLEISAPASQNSKNQEIRTYGDMLISQGDEYEAYPEEDSYEAPAPMGGRFGRFNVMTPITERTYEWTTSSKMTGTPSGRSTKLDKELQQENAVEIAEKLAAELQEEEFGQVQANKMLVYNDAGNQALNASTSSASNIFSSRPKVFSTLEDLTEHTGVLSLADALAVASAFKPPNPCVPTDPQITSVLVSLTPVDHFFYDIRTQESSKLDKLQSFAKASRRSSEVSDRFSLDLNGLQYEVTGKLGEGGFGAVFRATDLAVFERAMDAEDEDADEKSQVAIKVVRPRNIWEYHVLRRIHQTLPIRLQASVILPRSLYAYKDESFLVLDICQQGTLLDVVNNASSLGISQQGACLNELVVMFFTIELLRILEGLHEAKFIHGDLKIDNCLLRLEECPGALSSWSSVYQPSGDGGWKYKGVKVIDFGRSIDMGMFPPNQQFIADWKTEAGDCIEQQQNKPWTYQTDYFGLAGIVYCLLYGKYFEKDTVALANGEEPRYQLSVPFKRYWQRDIWTKLFDTLLNSCLIRPDGSLPICSELRGVREEMEEWLQRNCNPHSGSLKSLLKKLEMLKLS